MDTVSVLNSYADNLFALIIQRFCTALNYEEHINCAQAETTWLHYSPREIMALNDAMYATIDEFSTLARAWEFEVRRGA